MLMLDSSNVFLVVMMLLYFNKLVISKVIERDVRTDLQGSCTSGLLKNLSISRYTASSTLRNDSRFGPHAAMVDAIYELSISRSAWCPDKPVSDKPSEWLQVDFPSLKIIKNIFTFGRDDGNYGEYVTSYYFDYQRQNELTWYRYRDDDRGEVIKGNNDARNPTFQKFDSPLVARRIRIIPINPTPTRVCLRFMLYGCDFKDGVVEYQIPRGDFLSQGRNVTSFDDDRYDGSKFSNKTWLRGGMGKLMDNIVPVNSSNQNEMQKFFVGWNKTAKGKDYVELLFKFDTVRIFRSVSLYSANIPSLMILPFTSIIIELTDLKYKSATLKAVSPIKGDQPLMLKLYNKKAYLVKLTLFFKSTWMGLNEVVFDSEPSSGTNLPLNVNKLTTVISSSTEFTSKINVPLILISCFIAALVVLILLSIFCFIWVRQRKRRRYKSKLCDYRSMLMNDATYNSNIGNITTISGNNPLQHGKIDAFGANSSSTIGLRFIHPSFPQCQDYRAHSSNNSNDYEPIDSYWPKVSQQSESLRKIPVIDQFERTNLLIQGAPDITNVGVAGSVYFTGSVYSSHAYETHKPAPDIIPLTSITNDTWKDVFNNHAVIPLRGLLGSSISFSNIMSISSSWIESAILRLPEMGPTNVISQKRISEGKIGHIIKAIVDNYEQSVIVAEMKRNKISVDLKYAFYRQCFVIIKEDYSSHPNLISIIGKFTQDGLYSSIVYAYPSQVNVVSFFQKLRQIPKSNNISFSCSYVSQSSLLYLTKQLADALSFLNEKEVVHRDVSARNCNIGDRFHLILSDFAIGLEEFQDDYISFSSTECKTTKDNNPSYASVQLPLLWMPWEAIILGNFSSKSDVWSFGVTLWEIFTECQLKPYSISMPISKDDPSIILKNCLLIASSHPSSILPNGRTIDQTTFFHDKSTQTDISKQVRDMMYLCWQPNPSLRPNFQSLYSILSELSPESRYVDEYGTLHRMIS